jgi:hypothetical protein
LQKARLPAGSNAIRLDERDLRAAELAIRKLVELLSNQSGKALDQALVMSASEQLSEIVKVLNRRAPETVLIEKMREVPRISLEWQQP